MFKVVDANTLEVLKVYKTFKSGYNKAVNFLAEKGLEVVDMFDEEVGKPTIWFVDKED